MQTADKVSSDIDENLDRWRTPVGDMLVLLAVHRGQAWRLDPWCCVRTDWPGEPDHRA